MIPSFTYYPTQEDWWDDFYRRWGKKAWTADCAKCKHCLYDRYEGAWCELFNIRLGFDLDGVCRAWEPKDGDGSGGA